MSFSRASATRESQPIIAHPPAQSRAPLPGSRWEALAFAEAHRPSGTSEPTEERLRYFTGPRGSGAKADPFEREARATAASLARGPARAASSPPGAAAPSPRDASFFEQRGAPLDAADRAWLEPRFGASLDHVRIHTGADAARGAQALSADAFAIGNDIGFAAGRYAPSMRAGRALLAHEVTHAALHAHSGLVHRSSSSDAYTDQERADMAQGTMLASMDDRVIAQSLGLETGDIVFRLGSRNLGRLSGEPVTHGGIYLGDGRIHDMVGFGNRSVPISMFYAEAEDPSVVHVVRFTGPQRDLIVPRLIENILARDFDLPTDPLPWNLFSSADDYRTATCLEYSHAQFLHAIRQLRSDLVLSPQVLDEIERTYFVSGGDAPDPLIKPKRLALGGPMPSHGVMAAAVKFGVVKSADALATDIDPTVFENRWEGERAREYVGTVGYGADWLDTFTYSSFVNATQFFTVVR